MRILHHRSVGDILHGGGLARCLSISSVWPRRHSQQLRGNENFALCHLDCFLQVNEASGKIAVHLVKYWTLLLEILAIAAWICFCNLVSIESEGLAGPGPDGW